MLYFKKVAVRLPRLHQGPVSVSKSWGMLHAYLHHNGSWLLPRHADPCEILALGSDASCMFMRTAVPADQSAVNCPEVF